MTREDIAQERALKLHDLALSVLLVKGAVKLTKSALAVISLALALGLASQDRAEAGWCRGAPPGYCGGPFVPAPAVTHFVYYPQYFDIYYTATLLPDPYPAMYMPRGYWPRFERPYAAYGRRYWAPRICCGAPVVAVPAPHPVVIK